MDMVDGKVPVIVPAELKLEFNLIMARRPTANRAASADTRPSPHALRGVAG
jgi:hypothetical protein